MNKVLGGLMLAVTAACSAQIDGGSGPLDAAAGEANEPVLTTVLTCQDEGRTLHVGLQQQRGSASDLYYLTAVLNNGRALYYSTEVRLRNSEAIREDLAAINVYSLVVGIPYRPIVLTVEIPKAPVASFEAWLDYDHNLASGRQSIKVACQAE